MNDSYLNNVLDVTLKKFTRLNQGINKLHILHPTITCDEIYWQIAVIYADCQLQMDAMHI